MPLSECSGERTRNQKLETATSRLDRDSVALNLERHIVPLESRLRRFEPLQSSMVYICTGPESKRYHSNSNCRGLNKCSASIEKVTVAKAKSMKRTPCKICYK